MPPPRFLLSTVIEQLIVSDDLPRDLVFGGRDDPADFAQLGAIVSRLEAVLGGGPKLERSVASMAVAPELDRLVSESADESTALERLLTAALPNEHPEVELRLRREGRQRLHAECAVRRGERFPAAVVRLLAGLCARAPLVFQRRGPHVSYELVERRLLLQVTFAPAATASRAAAVAPTPSALLRATAERAERSLAGARALTVALADLLDGARDAHALASHAGWLARAVVGAHFSEVRAGARDARPRVLDCQGERLSPPRVVPLGRGARTIGSWLVDLPAGADERMIEAIAPWLTHALRCTWAMPRRSVGTPQRLTETWRLTPAEARVAAGLLRGDAMKEIASDLMLSASAVQARAGSVYRKAEVRTRAELQARARATLSGAVDRGPATPPLEAALPAASVEATSRRRRQTAALLRALHALGEALADDAANEQGSETLAAKALGPIDGSPDLEARDRAACAALFERACGLRAGAPPAGYDTAAWVLTPRQRDVVRALSTGRSSAAIARELGIRPHTVEAHLRAIFERTGLRSRHAIRAAAATSRSIGGGR